jgi:carbon monoxide dehydrogenase subunit G
MKIEVSRHVGAEPERVWAAIADVANSAHVISAIESVHMVAGPSPVEVGTTWRETRTVLGRSVTEEMRVTSVDPGRSYTVQAHSSGTDYESMLTVDRAADGAILTMTFAARATTGASRLMSATLGWVVRGSTRKSLERDVADVATFVELGPGAGDTGGTESGGRPFGP